MIKNVPGLDIAKLEMQRRQLLDNGKLNDVRRRRRYFRLAFAYWSKITTRYAQNYAKYYKQASISGRL